MDVAPGRGDQRAVGRNCAADIAQVIPCGYADGLAIDAPAEIVDVFCRQANNLTACDAAAIAQIALYLDIAGFSLMQIETAKAEIMYECRT